MENQLSVVNSSRKDWVPDLKGWVLELEVLMLKSRAHQWKVAVQDHSWNKETLSNENYVLIEWLSILLKFKTLI